MNIIIQLKPSKTRLIRSNLKPVEFDGIRMQVGLNSFTHIDIIGDDSFNFERVERAPKPQDDPHGTA